MTLGAKAIWTFMTIIYFFALVYSDVENDCSHATAYWECSVPFHSAIYFLITVRCCEPSRDPSNADVLVVLVLAQSLTSVGYGDIVPLTHLGRFVTVMVLLILIFLLPFFGGQVIALVQKQDRTWLCTIHCLTQAHPALTLVWRSSQWQLAVDLLGPRAGGGRHYVQRRQGAGARDLVQREQARDALGGGSQSLATERRDEAADAKVSRQPPVLLWLPDGQV